MDSVIFIFLARELLGSVNRYLSELLHSLHKVKGSLTCTSASSLISFLYLSLSVLCENLVLCLDLIYKLFHCFKV